MTALSDNGSHGYHDTSVGDCLFCSSRRRWRHLTTAFYIVAFLWLVAVILLRVVDRPTAIVNRDHLVKDYRDVFEAFNAHKMIFGGLSSEGDHDVTVGGGSALQEVSGRSNLTLSDVDFDLLGRFYFNDAPLLPPSDCGAILRGDEGALDQSKLLGLEFKTKTYEKERERLKKFDDELSSLAENCEDFLKNRKYFTLTFTAEERAYPLAYVITVHRKFSMFERLLRAIYQPQNIYCVHVDKKSPPEFLQSIRKLSDCFSNVFVASQLTEVHYSHWSRVEADLNCLKDLVARKHEVPWKYVINLCGQDFPLKTNLEITRSLKTLHGFNNMETITPPGHKMNRFKFHFRLPENPKHEYVTMEQTDVTKAPNPLDTPIFVGSAYYVMKRQAVEFILKDKTVEAFFEWSKDTYSPDEHVWATLQRNFPRVPGSHPPHAKYDLNELQSITRLVKWGGLDTSVYPRCTGHYSRGVCVYGVGDLPWLLEQHHLFANKFDYDVDPYAIECLDVWLRNRTLSQTRRYLSMGYL
ncbi:beta-1,3-galactosyl-O-glycosyl-glycoprotein beta-1,6-N-acetylglucosaminyltransferase-like [Clavelina lepadiformis]|uniref:beta-1,3-galactosyl-O-glycosyl-glycoprotein beta-1,6-N-acetylglucosaminyltransferase-like n=1 Tax=Clavelina lepadiformis TaxID=159417 RepID=UPI004042863F